MILRALSESRDIVNRMRWVWVVIWFAGCDWGIESAPIAPPPFLAAIAPTELCTSGGSASLTLTGSALSTFAFGALTDDPTVDAPSVTFTRDSVELTLPATNDPDDPDHVITVSVPLECADTCVLLAGPGAYTLELHSATDQASSPTVLVIDPPGCPP